MTDESSTPVSLAVEIQQLRAFTEQATGALRFIMAFYDPNQHYLDNRGVEAR